MSFAASLEVIASRSPGEWWQDDISKELELSRLFGFRAKSSPEDQDVRSAAARIAVVGRL
jgi:hypothetical protein